MIFQSWVTKIEIEKLSDQMGNLPIRLGFEESIFTIFFSKQEDFSSFFWAFIHLMDFRFLFFLSLLCVYFRCCFWTILLLSQVTLDPRSGFLCIDNIGLAYIFSRSPFVVDFLFVCILFLWFIVTIRTIIISNVIWLCSYFLSF